MMNLGKAIYKVYYYKDPGHLNASYLGWAINKLNRKGVTLDNA